MFSNNADEVDLGGKQHIIPIKTDLAAGRLSAILLERVASLNSLEKSE